MVKSALEPILAGNAPFNSVAQENIVHQVSTPYLNQEGSYRVNSNFLFLPYVPYLMVSKNSKKNLKYCRHDCV